MVPARTAYPELSIAALTVILGAARPVGAISLHQQLLRRGFDVSEATVGRLLRDFDRLDYTTLGITTGRRITRKGRAHLEALRNGRSRVEATQAIDKHLRADTLSQVMSVLLARRGIEREIARAAAVNATKADLAAIRERARRIDSGEDLPGIHELLAAAAHSPLLEAVHRLVTQDPQIRAALLRLTDAHASALDRPFHKRIIEALSRKDARAAESAIVQHIDATTAAVRKSWSALSGGSKKG